MFPRLTCGDETWSLSIPSHVRLTQTKEREEMSQSTFVTFRQRGIGPQSFVSQKRMPRNVPQRQQFVHTQPAQRRPHTHTNNNLKRTKANTHAQSAPIPHTSRNINIPLLCFCFQSLQICLNSFSFTCITTHNVHFWKMSTKWPKNELLHPALNKSHSFAFCFLAPSSFSNNDQIHIQAQDAPHF